MAEAGLRLIEMLQPLAAAGLLNAAQTLDVLAALRGGEPAERIHLSSAASGFLRLAEPCTGSQQQNTGKGESSAGAKKTLGHRWL